jgi:hypothetical protein
MESVAADHNACKSNARSLRIMEQENDRPHNLAELFRADGQSWKRSKRLTILEAVLLSLDIEPSSIEEVPREIEPMNFGLQDAEFRRRMAQVQLAVRNTSLVPVVASRGYRLPRLAKADFIRWARANSWSLPEWMARVVGSGEGVTPGGPTTTPALWRPLGREDLRRDLFTFTKKAENWLKVDGRTKRKPTEVCHAFLVSCRLHPEKYSWYVPGSPHSVAHLVNILTRHRDRGQWEPPGYRGPVRAGNPIQVR